MIVLNRWNLENKATFPNFKAVQELMMNNFNFDKDDYLEDSPL